MARVTRTVQRQRIAETMEVRLRGGEIRSVREHFENQGVHLTDNQLHTIIRQADKLYQSMVERDQNELFNYHLGQRRRLYSVAMNRDDLSTAHKVLKDEAELLGLYPAKRTEVSGPNGGPQLHQHNHLDVVAVLDRMNLSLETRRRLLHDIRTQQSEVSNTSETPPNG